MIFISSIGVPGSAEAICGKECREARDYCKSWEAGHPGQTCGRVRGAICSGSAWDKITQVNWAWSACRLVEGGADHAAAQQRCDAYEENWGGNCQVHSPLCNVGWIKLQKYGKFRACRPIEFTGTILDAYRAYMRKWEGLANLSIPAHLKPFIEEQYGFDPDIVRWGRVPNTDNSTCITDCSNINCDKDWVTNRISEGYDWHLNAEGGESNLLFHEMTHVKQCVREGGRDAYAMLWFSNLPLGIVNALVLGQKINADNVHDAMPMEIEGDQTGWAVLDNYVGGWWHQEAYCRIYRPDKKVVIFTSQDPHPRAFCDLKYGWQGARFLKDKIKELSFDHGNGTYHVGFGRPDESNGVWIGSVDVQNPIISAAFGASVSGETCPKPVDLNILIVTDKERSVRLRYKVGDSWSGWKQVFSKQFPTGTFAQLETTADYYAGPGGQTVKVEIENYPKVLEQDIDVECPPFAATKVSYAVRIGKGDLCPRQIDEVINFETNGPGTVRFGFREKGKGDLDLSPAYIAPTERSGNKYVASFQRSLMQPGEVMLERRVETLGADLIFSNWRPIKVECLDVLDSAIIYDGPNAGTCKFRTGVRLRVNADMESDLPYRLDCADGQSHDGSFAIRNTGPGNFIGVDSAELEVGKTEKMACALKSDLGDGLKVLTFQGNDVECLDVLDAGLFIDGPGQGPCPAELTMRARVNTRDMKPFSFGLVCTNGQTWSGMLPVEETGPNTYIGVMSRTLIITETGSIGCALKSKQTGELKNVAIRAKDYQCINVAVPGPGNDLTGEATSPGKPAIEPVPQVSVCRNGAIRNGDCVCRAGWNRRRISRLEFVCNRPVARIACENGTVQAGKCVCRKDWRLRRLSANRFSCQRPVVKLVCDGGKVSRGKCLCPRGATLRKRKSNNFACVKPQPRRIVCTGGVVRNGQCFCPRATKRKRLLANRFVCTCPRGTKLVRGQCIRPAG